MENRLNELVESLIESYLTIGGINRVDCGSSLPSNRKINSACDDLLQVLFPGYHDKEPVPAEELEVMTSERIARLMVVLSGEIAKTLRFRNGEDETDKRSDYSFAAQTVVSEFLEKLPDIRKILATDVRAAYEGDPAARNFEEIILAYPCITAISIQRCANALFTAKVPLIPRIMTEYAHGLTGIDIHPGATIGHHFFIDHGTGVVIGETCTIGNHVKLYHGVTLGARNFPKDGEGNIIKGNKRHPDVKDHVIIYPHATILGGQTVLGKGSTIAANVFLRESVPANSFVSTKGEELIVIDKETKKRIVSEN